MKVLKITEGSNYGELDRLFEETRGVDIEEVSPSVIDEDIDVKINGESIREYDGAFLQIPPENAVFGRVLIEIMEEKGLSLNYSSTGFFTMAKKNYLYYVLNDRDVPIPKTSVAASEKAVRNVGNDLEFPVVGREFSNLEEVETVELEDESEVQEFAEGIEYGDEFLVFQEKNEGEKYRAFVAGDTVISLMDNSDGWRIGTENLSYSTLPRELEEKVVNTRKAIGTLMAEVLLKGEKVIDVNPNPDLEMITEISGKNAFEAVASEMKQEGQ